MMAVPHTIAHRLVDRARRTPEAPAYRRRTEDGWISETWESVLEQVRSLSATMIAMGVQPGDRVALMLPSSPEWEYCHLAALAAGATVVGLDEHDAAENIRHVIAECAPISLLVHTGRLESLIASLDDPPRSVLVADFEQTSSKRLTALSAKRRDPPDAWPLADASLPATIVFSSGSTGRPKGLAYTNEQMCLAADAILAAFPAFGSNRRLVCWLPLSNLFQRIIDLCAMCSGAEVWFVEKPTEIAARLPEIRPHVFIAVPRFYEKLYAGIQDKIARSPLPVRFAIRAAWRIALFRIARARSGRRAGFFSGFAYRLADVLVLARIRAAMGGRVEFLISGSAPFPTWLLERFEGLGWTVLEAYGVSENIVPIALNTPDAHRFGSVGRPLPPNEVQLAEDGELLVRSAGISTSCAGHGGAESRLTPDGFLCTGDFATIDDDGYVWLVGRKSEIFKTSTGRRIAPVPIENCLKSLPYVEHAVVFGSARPVPVALLSIDPRRLGRGGGAVGDWRTTFPGIASDLQRACSALAAHERPAGILVTTRAFTIGDGDLTANLKLRRTAIEERYRDALDGLYVSVATRGARSDVPVVAA